ncbi:MAG: hypothetical protein F6K58_09995 [Symploca sp. SIO2E9]|nr:hypothetical protein [Symploca sp. SIO2E9]
MGELVGITAKAIASLVILATGIYLSIVFSNRVLHSQSHIYRRLWCQSVCLLTIALVAAITLRYPLGVIAFDAAPWTIDLQPINITRNLTNLIAGTAKLAIAPNHRQNTWTNVSIGGGGYVTGIYLHPLQKDLVYLKTDVSGFYRWHRKTQRWKPLTDHFRLEQLNYYSGEGLALDPNNSQILYIAAGAYSANWWPHKGTIFKSTDQGETWVKLNLDLKMGGNEPKRWAGERLVVNPSDSKVIFFGSRLDGLWKSSDAGVTWNQVTSFPSQPNNNIGILSIAFDKNIPGLVYANAYGEGIYRSTDLGLNWDKIDQSPQAANRLVVASDSTLYVTSAKKPGVSTYANGVWRQITPKNSKKAFNGLSVNPHSPQEIVVSTREKSATNIYWSVDGGKTWTQKRRATNNRVSWWEGIMLKQPSVSAIEFDPKVTDRVWLSDWYGVWRTEDIRAKQVVWSNYIQGYEATVVFSLVSPPSGVMLLSALADVDGFYHDKGLNAYPSREFGSSGPSFQDTYSIAYCETKPLRMVRVGGRRWNNTYTGATSQDGGKTWQEFASFPKQKMPMRVAMSATNPDLFVVTISQDQAIRTTDGGASWQRVSGLPPGPEGSWNWSQSLAADPVEGNTFYYYYNDQVYRSTDGGASFEVVYKSLSGENKWHSLKTMPGVKGEVWISLDKNGLYHSTNGGKSFSQIAGVEQAYLFAFGKPPRGSTTPALYLYGKIASNSDRTNQDRTSGIFRSLDQGETWTYISDPENPIGNNPKFMEASKQKFGLVFIGTGGRGIYYFDSPNA